MNHILKYCLAAGLFLALLATLFFRVNSGRLDPHAIIVPSQTTIAPITGTQLGNNPTFNADNLTNNEHPIMVSFFASWCVPCVQEMRTLRELSKQIEIFGVAYQDKPERALTFINRDGSPFTKLLDDQDGHMGIEWHITGVPENFLIYKGKVLLHQTGSLDLERVKALLETLKENS